MERWSSTPPDPSTEAPSVDYLDALPIPRHPVALPLLLPGTMVNVRTKNTLYRLTVLDGPSRQISILGGRVFPRRTTVEVLGSRGSDDVLKPGWIVEGLQLQLATPDGPVITSIVESVDVEVDPAALTEEITG